MPYGAAGKESICNAGDLSSIPGLGRSGEGKGYPLQYSGLENSMDCRVHGVAKSRTRLNNFHISLFKTLREFPGGLEPGFGTFTTEAGVQPLVRELRSCKLHGVAEVWG